MLETAGGQDHAELNAGLLAGVTDRGVRHQRNEDAIALAVVPGPEGQVPLAVVSDGVSSAPRPDEASLAAVHAAIEVLSAAAQAGDDLAAASAAAVREAASALADLAGNAGAPAATYVSAVVSKGTVTVCWLGDSRAYWLAPDPAECARLTRDDSLAEELVAAGLPPEEAMATPQAHVITRWLGADLPEPEPHVAAFEPPGSGILLLCSDGLWNYCPEAEDLGVLVPFPGALTDPLAAAAGLVKFAVDQGGMDNVTVALIPFPPAPLPRTTANKVPGTGVGLCLRQNTVAQDCREGWQTRGKQRWRRCGGRGFLGAGTRSVSGMPSWLVPGSRIAGYRVEEFLGAGGMAAVYRAYHEGMGRGVALKVLAAGLATDEAFRARFVREARAVAKVEHPHIIPVYEAGEKPLPFIAMRLVRGGDLREMVTRDGAMTAGRAAAFVSPVASALDAAHEVNLVHRDVKPANMLVDAGRGRPEHVYLSDFGLARGLDTGGLTANLTSPGQFMGTPEYAAPEQITGQDVDGRADQYALACVAYTLLTGSAPYVRDQAYAVMYAQLYDPPPLVTAVRRDLPGAVNKVLAHAMEKKPEDRFESCNMFADALREALDLPPWGAEGSGTYPRPGQDADQQPPTGGVGGGAPTVWPPGRPRGGQGDQLGTRGGLPTWTAVVAADRGYYEQVWAPDVSPEQIIRFPDGCPERSFSLAGAEMLIGRRSASRKIQPEIDLTLPTGGPPTDTGVSREHAKLVAARDGSWSVVDLGTENGTLVNGQEIPPRVLIRLNDGDRINLGMWTLITIRKD